MPEINIIQHVKQGFQLCVRELEASVAKTFCVGDWGRSPIHMKKLPFNASETLTNL